MSGIPPISISRSKYTHNSLLFSLHSSPSLILPPIKPTYSMQLYFFCHLVYLHILYGKQKTKHKKKERKQKKG